MEFENVLFLSQIDLVRKLVVSVAFSACGACSLITHNSCWALAEIFDVEDSDWTHFLQVFGILTLDGLYNSNIRKKSIISSTNR